MCWECIWLTAGSEFSHPPPQRPSSPIHKDGSKSAATGNGQLRLQTGDAWLAGGRDLHWESLHNRSRSKNQPGWKEALRPKSAAALRAMRYMQWFFYGWCTILELHDLVTSMTFLCIFTIYASCFHQVSKVDIPVTSLFKSGHCQFAMF